jgi:Cu+-exporting ATPase
MQTNVALAVAANVIGIVLAATGFITPVLAIVFILASIVAITLNTLRIRGIDLRRGTAHEGSTAALAETEFRVSPMVCGGCAEKIVDVLQPLPGVRDVKPKVAQKQVLVRYEPAQIEREQIKDALGRAGYTAVET